MVNLNNHPGAGVFPCVCMCVVCVFYSQIREGKVYFASVQLFATMFSVFSWISNISKKEETKNMESLRD